MKKNLHHNSRLLSQEVNFDGLVGLTHNYAGLSHGNIASQANRKKAANPRQAALQGLDKMRYLASRGIPQAILPPQMRPDLDWLRRLGFTGKDQEVIEKAGQQDAKLLAAAWSASAMWTANAATLSPSVDSADGKVHITPANLASQVHRSLETPHTTELLRRIFAGPRFVHHDPLPTGNYFWDEGAANHIRLASQHHEKGVQVFVYGFSAALRKANATRRFLPRQSQEASEAVARLHALAWERTVVVAQSPIAIDAGVFHNDVISVGNADVLFCHEAAFLNRSGALREIKRKFAALGNGSLRLIEVKSQQVSLATSISTYLFNSQILSLPGGGMLLLAAEECRQHPRTRKFLEQLPGLGLGITEVAFVNLRQSMRNGGGPACLRLRAVLTPAEWADVSEGVKFNDLLYSRLSSWVKRYYRDRVVPGDLLDPELLKETRAAAQELDHLLGFSSVSAIPRKL